MAEHTRTAILSVTHFSKAGANNTTKALHRFIGSIAFTGAPRAAFAVIEDAEHDGRRLFLHAKNNLAPAPQGLAFRLEQCLVGDGIVASRICGTANRCLSRPMRPWQPKRLELKRELQRRKRRISCSPYWLASLWPRPMLIGWRGSMA